MAHATSGTLHEAAKVASMRLAGRAMRRTPCDQGASLAGSGMAT